jgi:hypothetical protein
MILGITGHRPPRLGCGYDTPNPVCQLPSPKGEGLFKSIQAKVEINK